MAEAQTRFAIMGSGGVGGYFGARLAQAGHAVYFIARGAHLEAIRANGLQVEGPEEAFTIDADVTDSPAAIGTVDFVLFSVKLWDTEQAARACQALIGADTAVVSLQNGVDSEGLLQSILGEHHVMGGVAEISAVIAAPGHIRKLSPFHRIRFGELAEHAPERAAQLGQCLAQAGIEYEHCDDIRRAIWNKFIMLTGLSALTALTRKPIGEIREASATRRLLEEVMTEVAALAAASNVKLAGTTVENRLKAIDALPADMRASMAMDLEEGRRLELPWLSGAVTRLGSELGLPTPANGFIEAALTLHVDGTG